MPVFIHVSCTCWEPPWVRRDSQWWGDPGKGETSSPWSHGRWQWGHSGQSTGQEVWTHKACPSSIPKGVHGTSEDPRTTTNIVWKPVPYCLKSSFSDTVNSHLHKMAPINLSSFIFHLYKNPALRPPEQKAAFQVENCISGVTPSRKRFWFFVPNIWVCITIHPSF